MRAKLSITSEIFQVGGNSLSAPEDAAVYLVVINGHAALIDAGCGNSIDSIMDNINACGIDASRIDYLLLTHCHFDHTGGAAEIRALTGCKIIAHELDAVYLETGDRNVTAASWYGASIQALPIDRKLKKNKEIIDLGGRSIKAIHMPGHSPGSVVYVLESDNQIVLFGQDVHGPLDASFKSDRDAYQTSLQYMLELKADILCEGHFGVYKGKDRVNQFISGYLEV